jgi:hypothetical protein
MSAVARADECPGARRRIARSTPSARGSAWLCRRTWSDVALVGPSARHSRDSVDEIELGISGDPSGFGEHHVQVAAMAGPNCHRNPSWRTQIGEKWPPFAHTWPTSRPVPPGRPVVPVGVWALPRGAPVPAGLLTITGGKLGVPLCPWNRKFGYIWVINFSGGHPDTLRQTACYATDTLKERT